MNENTLVEAALQSLAEGQRVWMRFGGASMMPTLRPDDRVLIEPLDGSPAAGDVLWCRVGGRNLVHRLVDVEGDTLVLLGDNNTQPERVGRGMAKGRIVRVRRADGSTLDAGTPDWQRMWQKAKRRQRTRRLAVRWLGRKGRKQLRPWYFAALALLMWAPINGFGLSLDNYLLGLRADHLLHASVFVPCSLFLIDFFPRHRWLAWLAAIAIGQLTERVQYLLPYRGFDINDMVANALGSTLGFTILIFAMAAWRRRAGSGSTRLV